MMKLMIYCNINYSTRNDRNQRCSGNYYPQGMRGWSWEVRIKEEVEEELVFVCVQKAHYV